MSPPFMLWQRYSVGDLGVGTGAAGALPVTDEVAQEAERRNVELISVPTAQAIEALRSRARDTNAILHVTC